MKGYFNRTVVIGFFVVLVALSCLGIYSYISLQRLIDTARLLSAASRIVNTAEKLLVTTIDMETGMRGYVITSDESFLQPYDSASKNVRQTLNDLVVAASADPAQRRRVDSITVLLEARQQHIATVVKARGESFEKARDLVASGDGQAITDRIRRLITVIQEHERANFRRQNTITGDSLIGFQYAFLGLLIVPAAIIVGLLYRINRHLALRDKTEKELRVASEEITYLNKELEGYTYSVSHDLRAPLRSIAGYSQVLKEDFGPNLDDEGKRIIDVVIKNAVRMGQLIDDLLDFSRIGKKEITKTRCNVEEIVHSTIDELTTGSAKKTEIEILPLAPVHADPSMLRQVWQNLISNAIKYSGKKERPKVEIGSYRENGSVCYYVKDNGVGFNMLYKDKLFGVFQRLHKLDEFEGTGVGLALVKRIVNRHGGKIWAEGILHEGATFYFSIPEE